MEKYFGLTKKRYDQMMDLYGNDREAVRQTVDCWGVENCNNSYAIFNYDGTGLLDIEAIADVSDITDDDAVLLAKADGVKIIPEGELPVNMPENMRFYGWVDTEENRRNIEIYCRNLDGNKRSPDMRNIRAYKKDADIIRDIAFYNDILVWDVIEMLLDYVEDMKRDNNLK